MLELTSRPYILSGLWCAQWSLASKSLINQVRPQLAAAVKPYLCASCCRLKGHGGVKGAVRWLKRQLPHFSFVARFDVASYYQSLRHPVLLQILTALRVADSLRSIVATYLSVPDLRATGVGIIAGGSLSPLLGALYLLPLDQAMRRHFANRAVFYVRYVDDLLILAKSRPAFRAAIKTVYAVTESLGLHLHQKEKRFIGRTSAGFDFLSYHIHPAQKVRPSSESLRRLVERAHRLHEQGVDANRLRRYVLFVG